MTVSPDAPTTLAPSYENLEAIAESMRTSGGRIEVATLCRYVETLIALGLLGAAQNFLTTLHIDHPHWTVFKETTLAHITNQPTGIISWESRRRRYQANLAAFLKRWPQHSALFNDCERRAAQYQLHLSRDGNYQLRDTTNLDPLACWQWGLKNHQSTGDLWKHAWTEPTLIAPAAFDGLGFGWLLLRNLEKTERSFLNYSPAAYVIEPDPLALWILFHLHDLRSWLQNPRLHLYVGPAARDQYIADLNTDSLTLPDYYFTNPLLPRDPIDLISIATTIAARRKETERSLLRTIDQTYANRDPQWWATRYKNALNGGPPLKVVGITSRFTTVLQYSMDEVGKAVTAAGHEFYLSKEPDDSSLERNTIALIHQVQPDLIIQISRLRYEFTKLPQNIPFLCWDQDYLPGMRTPEAKASLNFLTYVAGHAATYGHHNAGWPARNSIFCHLAAATHRYSNAPVDPSLLAHYACDFSYVSNCAQTPEAYAHRLGTQWTAQVTPNLWQSLSDEILSADHVHSESAYWTSRILALADETKSRIPQSLDNLTVDLLKIVDRRFRHQALHWIVDYCRESGATLKLYGRDWESTPAFAPFAAGSIEPGLPSRALYQATQINLQLLLGGFIHARALDGLASGGFFLTRHSDADYDPDPKAPEFYRMARRALDLGIWNFDDLVASTDPVIADRRLQFDVHRVGALQLSDYTCFHIAGEMPAAATVFPDMRAISFRTAEEFCSKAEKYRQNPDERLSITTRMHQIARQRFSYDARVKLFFWRLMRGFALGHST